MARTPGSYLWSRWTKEAAFGAFNGTGSTPIGGATVMWIPLEQDGLVLDADPKRWTIRTADGYNIRTQRGTQRYGVTGSLKVDAWPTITGNLIPSAFTPTGSGASKALDSWTVDYNQGYEVVRTLGVRVAKGSMSSTDSDNDPLAKLNLDLIGKSQVSDGSITLAAPALTVFPFATERPFAHNDLTLSLFGGSRTGLKSARVEVTNILYVAFFESTTVDRISYNGRDIMAMVELIDPVVADRTRFEQQTAGAFSLAWNNTAATKSVTFNGEATAYYDARKDSRRFGEDMAVSITLLPIRDATAATEMAVTIV